MSMCSPAESGMQKIPLEATVACRSNKASKQLKKRYSMVGLVAYCDDLNMTYIIGGSQYDEFEFWDLGKSREPEAPGG
ncbi:hypothetical protein BJX99DRAFT_241772 [Aspergillus californicus]